MGIALDLARRFSFTFVTLEDDFVLSPRFVTRNVAMDGETSSLQRIFAGSAPTEQDSSS